VFAILSIIKYPLEFEDLDIGWWYYALSLTLGIACFLAGMIYYTRRVER
jgi:hypothetical protein